MIKKYLNKTLLLAGVIMSLMASSFSEGSIHADGTNKPIDVIINNIECRIV